MWVFAAEPDVFVSVVADTNAAEMLVVRARLQGDIESLFPNAVVRLDAGKDYRFRATLPRALVAQVLASRIQTIQYSNFKAASDQARHDDLLGVWRVMRRAQERARRQEGTQEIVEGLTQKEDSKARNFQ